MLIWSSREIKYCCKFLIKSPYIKNKSSIAPYLGPIQVVRLHIGWLVSLRLLGEGNGCAYKAEERKEMLKTNNNNKKYLSKQTNKLTGLWTRCSSSWGGNRS